MKKYFVVLIMAALAVSSAFCSVWVTSSTKLTNAAAHTLTARYLGGTLSCTAGGLDLGSPSYDTGETSYTASGEPDTSYTLAWVTSSGSVTPSSYQWYKNGSAIVGATTSSYTVNESEAGDYVFACKAVANGVEYECNMRLLQRKTFQPLVAHIINIKINVFHYIYPYVIIYTIQYF